MSGGRGHGRERDNEQSTTAPGKSRQNKRVIRHRSMSRQRVENAKKVPKMRHGAADALR